MATTGTIGHAYGALQQANACNPLGFFTREDGFPVMRVFHIPRPLSVIALGITVTLAQTPARAQDISIDTSSKGALHNSMLEAAKSGHKQDWTHQIKSPFCNGCYIEPPNLSDEANLNPDSAPMRIGAEKMDTVNDDEILLQGEVEVYQGWRRMRADRLHWFQNEERIELEGDVQFREPGLLLTSDSAWIDNKNGLSEFENPHYLMHERGLRGGAVKMRGRNDNGRILLDDASYTSCPPNDQTWKLQAQRIELDRESGFGKARHAVLDVGKVPVFYWPYLEFPIDDKRHSGFLWPSIGGSDNGGIDFTLPYYFNLAPNYDFTYSPRYLNTHGLIHQGEFRYLNQYSEWVLGGSYIGNSKNEGDLDSTDYAGFDRERWLTVVNEKGLFDRNWSSEINYQRVSDIAYFHDLSVRGLDVERALFLREAAQIAFNTQQWSFSALVEDHQKLLPDYIGDINHPETVISFPDGYQLLPRLNLGYNNGWTNKAWQPLFTSQYTFFNSDSFDAAPSQAFPLTTAYAARGQRLYVEPGLSYPVRGLAGFAIPAVKVKQASFELNDSNQFETMRGTRDITVPTFSLDTGLFFEREAWLGNAQYLNTLEPRLFYYYAGYVNQDSDELPIFDTSKLAFGYQQLFRDRRFSSYDRIEDANQLTVSAATRWIDEDSGREMLSLGVGQILYFRDRRVTLSPKDGYTVPLPDNPTLEQVSAAHTLEDYLNTDVDKELYRNASDIASELQWNPTEDMTLISSHTYDPYNDSTVEYALTTQWHSENYQKLLSGSYRFRRVVPLYTPNANQQQTSTQLVDTNIEQFTLTAVYPIARRWTLFANWSYEMTNRYTIQDLSGAEYESCCYRLRLFYERNRESFNA